MALFTIGYGNDNIDDFLGKLTKYEVATLYDLRSKPMSRWQPKFNRKQLEMTLNEKKIEYKFVGDKLGGYMEKKEWDLSLLEKIASQHKTDNQSAVIMCSEWDSKKCHRRELADLLEKKCYNVKHIDKYGDLEIN